MLISRNWLQTFFDEELPSIAKLADALTFHSFEIESVTKKGNDEILDVKVLPNRAHDCLCHLGTAKEISAILNIPLKVDHFEENIRDIKETSDFSIKIETNKVKRFKVAVIQGVEVKDSPEWLKQRIESMGGKSINNIVDITNFVMFELGQPMHAFDADKIIGEKKSFCVRESQKGEKITTLEGTERELESGSIVIADGSDTNILLGIAGVKGGAHAEITKNTKNIILEAATFDAETIRKTSTVLNIKTDASKRFENGLSPEIPSFAIDLALKLIEQEAKSENFEIKGVADFNYRKRNPFKIGFSLKEINGILGTEIKEDEVKNILERLKLKFELVNDPTSVAFNISEMNLNKSYKWGSSISYDAPNSFDCASLVAYSYANSGVSIPRISIDQFVFGDAVNEEDIRTGDLIFAATGIIDHGIRYETIEFMKGTKVPEGVDHVGICSGDGFVIHATSTIGKVVKEKISESEMFRNVVGYRRVVDAEKRFVVTVPFERLDLIAHTEFNISGNKEDLIEEIGRIYGLQNIRATFPDNIKGECETHEEFYKAESVREALVKNGFSEVYTYAMVNEGEVEIENPIASDKKFMRSSLEIGIERAMHLSLQNAKLLGIEYLKIFEIGKIFKNKQEEIEVRILEGKIENILTKSSIGSFQSNHYSLDEAFKKFCNEVMMDVSKIEIRKDVPMYKRISPYPFALRDIALWVPQQEPSETVKDIIVKNAGEHLVRVDQFDEYRKDDKVSFAYHLVFQAYDKTLTEEEINKSMARITETLIKSGYTIR